MKLTRNPNLTLDAPTDAHTPAGPPLGGWTGLEPQQCPGYSDASGTLQSLSVPRLDRCTRSEVRDYFNNTWTLSEVLFSGLRDERAYYSPPYHQLRHPLIFYYAHPPVLYVNKLRLAGLIAEPVNPYYETLFETGVDEMSWDDMSKNEMDWPEVGEVASYRKQVYELVLRVIDEHPGLADGHEEITWESELWSLFMGFAHERIHVETSSVLMRELPVAWMQRPEAWPADAPGGELGSPPASPSTEWVEHEGGTARLGKPRGCPTFGWDNEYGETTRDVGPFAMSSAMISNGDFHAFVADGGYRKQELWTAEGWSWREFRNTKWPTFWVSEGPTGLHLFKLRTVFEVIEMPWSWPAIVNHHEAKAFCRWLGVNEGEESHYRLPTEGEYGLLRAKGGGVEPDPVMQRDSQAFRDAGTNLNLAFGSECSVQLDEANDIRCLDGNVWRWCEDDFHPLEGFAVHPSYDDFSTPCFQGEHKMILGGSFASTGVVASRYGRYQFRHHFFQHAGFHVVREAERSEGGGAVLVGAAADQGQTDKYEKASVLAQYLELHYGSPEEAMPHASARFAAEFPRRCAELVQSQAAAMGLELEKALDIGCAVGRSSFELARTCPSVEAVDISEAFIQTCQHLQREGGQDYLAPDEGLLRTERVARVPEEIDRSRVTFRRADAMALPPEYANFDAVLIANVFCRLPSPGACLRRLGGARGLVRPGGLLVVTSPYSWHPDFTPEELWLGGRLQDGVEIASKDGLAELLDPDFELVHEEDMPFVIREHVRKYELVFSHATAWKRRDS